MCTLIVASLKGENELEKPWNASRGNDHPRREVYSATEQDAVKAERRMQSDPEFRRIGSQWERIVLRS
jgi:hypothetical protein